MAVLRTVVPDWVGVVDGDNEGHIRWGGHGRHVAGVDAIGGGVAWFIEADRLRDGMILVDDILMSDLSTALCGIAQGKYVLSIIEIGKSE